MHGKWRSTRDKLFKSRTIRTLYTELRPISIRWNYGFQWTSSMSWFFFFLKTMTVFSFLCKLSLVRVQMIKSFFPSRKVHRHTTKHTWVGNGIKSHILVFNKYEGKKMFSSAFQSGWCGRKGVEGVTREWFLIVCVYIRWRRVLTKTKVTKGTHHYNQGANQVGNHNCLYYESVLL